ncbi:hypothetical protein B0H13DRAFT_2350907 [Mycena leptocephala]|nr:hypothetical protein B0H13DRAFT_2350907 [Mycena leptocephala]
MAGLHETRVSYVRAAFPARRLFLRVPLRLGQISHFPFVDLQVDGRRCDTVELQMDQGDTVRASESGASAGPGLLDRALNGRSVVLRRAAPAPAVRFVWLPLAWDQVDNALPCWRGATRVASGTSFQSVDPEPDLLCCGSHQAHAWPFTIAVHHLVRQLHQSRHVWWAPMLRTGRFTCTGPPRHSVSPWLTATEASKIEPLCNK